jgi:hypothetical protein
VVKRALMGNDFDSHDSIGMGVRGASTAPCATRRSSIRLYNYLIRLVERATVPTEDCVWSVEISCS